jgi:hypothetical protein
MIVWEFNFSSELLCIGERVKGGRYKPTAVTLRYSQLVGALRLRAEFAEIEAVGCLTSFRKEFLAHSLTDRYADKAKLPLKVEYLTDVRGKVYIFSEKEDIRFSNLFDIKLGAMLSMGFGACRLEFIKSFRGDEQEKKEGGFISRLPIRAQNQHELNRMIESGELTLFLKKFGIDRVLQPFFGYLFRPVNEHTGHYELALFEQSRVNTAGFLIS